ncbi:sugar porter family MFS transporter [Microbacterium sp. MPKO10]|uniref:sugar porter family MFS transporter n=1 Tax=Microbacterium sp. MPKO10 TaxID=2989818 RepID=UPI0035586BAF
MLSRPGADVGSGNRTAHAAHRTGGGTVSNRSPKGAIPMSPQSTPYTKKAYGLSIAAAVGGFLFGFDSSVINGAVDAVDHTFSLGPALTGVIVAVALLGCALGAWIGGGIADRYGRLRVIFIGGILFLVSSVGAGLTIGPWDLLLWRVLGGIGIGIASVVTPAYIAEISPRQIRGTLASYQQLAITLGIFAALLSDAMLATSAGGASEQLWVGLAAWRWMFLVGAVPALVYIVLSFTLPESPRYLLAKKRVDEARAIFKTLVIESEVERNINDINKAIEADEKNTGASLRGSVLGLQGVVWVGIILSVFQQFVGINVIFYYSTSLWKAVGFTEESSLLVSVITSVTNVVLTFVAIFLVDRVGRRPILLSGSILMTIALGTMALAFSFASKSGDDVSLPGAWGPIALIAANLFVIGFAASWGPLVWVLLGEIFPPKIRGKALGVAAAAQWLANFAITVTFPSMSAWSLPLTYGMYAVFAALSFVFVLAKVPETKGMELEQAETLFTK